MNRLKFGIDEAVRNASPTKARKGASVASASASASADLHRQARSFSSSVSEFATNADSILRRVGGGEGGHLTSSGRNVRFANTVVDNTMIMSDLK